MNIKNPEAHRLAVAISQATGVSITQVVIEALREHYERLQRKQGKASLDELAAIADRVAEHVEKPYPPHGEVLYDEFGLSR